MPNTLLQQWHRAFRGPSNAPDANRYKTSGGKNAIKNSLSDQALGMNNWTSKTPVPSTRHTQKIGLLWDTFLNPQSADPSFGNGGNVTDPELQNTGAMSVRFDGKTHRRKQRATSNVVNAVIRQNNIRVTGIAEAYNAFLKGGYDEFFKYVDKIKVAESFTKNNYRLAAADENGSFSNLTSRAERNVIDCNEQATISLETFRTTQ